MASRWINNLIHKKYFHRITIMIIITIILFILGIIVLKYQVEGETNMPFYLSKISIISSSEGVDQPATDSKWAFDVYQSNDIFLYLEKNDHYGKTEVIKSVVIDNFQIEAQEPENIKIYQPDEVEDKAIFKNKEENCIQNIEYQGDMHSNLKQRKISNQGGLIAFRCSNNNVTFFTSDEEEINHNEILKKAGVKQEELEVQITFDLKIQLEDGKQYKTTIHLKLPVEDVIEKGTTATEITDRKEFVFKRVNN